MPYYSVDSNGKASGFSIDLFEAIAKDIDIKYQYIEVGEWHEFWALLNSGAVDIIPDIGVLDKRRKKLLFSQPTNTFEIKIYKRVNSKHLKSITDFEDKTVAVVGENVGITLMNKYPKISIEVFGNRFDAFYALLSGEVDGFCYPKPLIEYSLKKLNLEDKVEALNENVYEIKRAIGVTLEHKELLEKINKSFEKMQKNGTYDFIYQKWFGKEKIIELSYEQMVYMTIIVILLMAGFFSLIIFYSIRKKWIMTEYGLKQELDIRTRDLQELNKKLEQLATVDVLTGIFNRRYFFDVAKQYLEIAKRNKSKLCVISLDLDKFKNINDTYGHQAGDKVLIEFATTVNLFMRKSDIFARIGGEEFVVLIQNTDMKNTMIVCEKIRKEVEHSSVEYKDNIINFSVSIGVAEFTKENSIDELLEKSDTALYKAKESGRNQVLEYK
jgi:diguanylate cyclase (GGDEF)-like protein